MWANGPQQEILTKQSSVSSNQNSPLLRLPTSTNRSCSVKSNQESCLLRLPAEIRNQIWKFALLRVCRQIYAETALHPITTSVFQVSDCSELRKATKSFRKYQLAHITGVHTEVNDLHFQGATICISSSNSKSTSSAFFPTCVAYTFVYTGAKPGIIHRSLTALLFYMSILEIKCERLDMAWSSRRWTSTFAITAGRKYKILADMCIVFSKANGLELVSPTSGIADMEHRRPVLSPRKRR